MFCAVQEEEGEAALREDMGRMIMSLLSQIEFEMIVMMTSVAEGISFASKPQCILNTLRDFCVSVDVTSAN